MNWIDQGSGSQYRPLNTELLSTNSAGSVQYCVPNKVDRFDFAGISVPTVYDTPCMSDVAGGYFQINYKGFNYGVEIPSDVASGVTKTITVPNTLSTATIQRLGTVKIDQTVYVVNPGITSILNDTIVTTNGAGEASFAIPNGTQFRFYVETCDGNYYSNVLTAPSNGNVRIVAQDTPALVTPADEAEFTTSDDVDFKWNTISGASDYVWYIRASNQTNFSGYLFSGNEISVQFSEGTWDWLVQARNASGTVIAQSGVRSFTVTVPAAFTFSSPVASGVSGRTLVNSPFSLKTNHTSKLTTQPYSTEYFSDVAEQIEDIEFSEWNWVDMLLYYY